MEKLNNEENILKTKAFNIHKDCTMYNLGVSPSLVSRYCEGYSFWST